MPRCLLTSSNNPLPSDCAKQSQNLHLHLSPRAVQAARRPPTACAGGSFDDGSDPNPNPNPSPNLDTFTPWTAAAEDKRRRNTAASARFREKKKEREAALEGRALELDVRISELEKECEELRRENVWLKKLVVGTDAQPASTTGGSGGGKKKRGRDESGAAH